MSISRRGFLLGAAASGGLLLAGVGSAPTVTWLYSGEITGPLAGEYIGLTVSRTNGQPHELHMDRSDGGPRDVIPYSYGVWDDYLMAAGFSRDPK